MEWLQRRQTSQWKLKIPLLKHQVGTRFEFGCSKPEMSENIQVKNRPWAIKIFEEYQHQPFG